MDRFVFRYRQPGPKPPNEVEGILAHPDVKLVENTGRMLVVEGNAATVTEIARDFPEWACSAMQSSIRLPTDPKEKITRRLDAE